MACSRCKATVPEDANFCPSCGRKLADQTIRMAGLMDRFLQDRGYKGQDLAMYRIKFWKDRIGDLCPEDVSSKMIERCLDALSRSGASRNKPLNAETVRRYLYDLVVVFRDYTNVSPLVGVVAPKSGPSKAKILTVEQKAQLLEACQANRSPYLTTLVVLACETGLLRRELIALKWDAINLGRRQLTVESPKRERQRTIELNEEALRVLESHERLFRRATTSRVFPAFVPGSNVGCNFVYAWKRVRKDTGMMDFQFNELRNEYGQRLADGGSTPVEVAKALGFRSTDAAMKFTYKQEPNREQEEAARWQRAL